MQSKALTLVVGATGLLGGGIVRLLRQDGRAVRAAVRASAPKEKLSAISAAGAEVVIADLKDPFSLRSACQGAQVVISTASATLSRQDGDSIETVDRQGQLALVEIAEMLGVGHFVHVSLPPQGGVRYALLDAKQEVEARLAASRMTCTVLRPAWFSETWLSPAVGFDPIGGRVRVFGTGENPVSWIAVSDVATFAAASCTDEKLRGKTLDLGGPEPLSPRQVVGIFENFDVPRITVESIPEPMLEDQLRNAGDALAETFAALALTMARGLVIDPSPSLALVPVSLRTVREHAEKIVYQTRHKH